MEQNRIFKTHKIANKIKNIEHGRKYQITDIDYLKIISENDIARFVNAKISFLGRNMSYIALVLKFYVF